MYEMDGPRFFAFAYRFLYRTDTTLHKMVQKYLKEQENAPTNVTEDDFSQMAELGIIG